MSPSGGTFAKLGHIYEGWWTIWELLDVLTGRTKSIVVEAIDREESLGVEFHTIAHDGSRTYHSAKRRHSEGEWTLSRLTYSKKNGRSVLEDLLKHLDREQTAQAVFVSGSSATDLDKLCWRATHTDSLTDFRRELEQSPKLDKKAKTPKLCDDVKKYLLPLSVVGRDWHRLYEFLKRLEVVPIGDGRLRGQVDRLLPYLCYHDSDRDWQPQAVRVLLGDFLYGRLGMTTTADESWAFLRTHGYHYRNWGSYPTVPARVGGLTKDFLAQVNRELINKGQIPRTVVPELFGALRRDDGPRVVLLAGSGSVGKSCVLAQVVRELQSADVPVLPFRLDRCGAIANTRALGRRLADLPESPALVLAGMFNERRAVLAVDQLDVVSELSGGRDELFDVFDSLRREVEDHSFLRMVVACRTFDVEHDHRLRLLSRDKAVLRVDLQPLTDPEIDNALTTAKEDPRHIDHVLWMLVRCCLFNALLAYRNCHRDHAVELFMRACDGADALFASRPYERFVQYATFTHYQVVRPLLQRGLKSKDLEVVKVAARQTAFAALGEGKELDRARRDAAKVRRGTETMREAAARIYARNIAGADVGPLCRQYLRALFNDRSKNVRAAAAACFHYLPQDIGEDYLQLITRYLRSRAFPNPHDRLLHKLEDSRAALPGKVALDLVDRFIEQVGDAGADIATSAAADSPIVAKLVFRQYAQARDPKTRKRCLDLIDRMERHRFHGLDRELSEHDE